jgi:tRNA pseudouridine55 synthase
MKQKRDGILLIDKEMGETSYQVVKRVRFALGRNRTTKVGHAGTLDPFATGLLLILVGQGTKISHFIMSENKVYLATMKLGVETDTFDPTGEVVRTRTVPDIKPSIIQSKAKAFVGTIEQRPPAFSALKYRGKRAYELARKGVAVDLQKRKVTIHSLVILSVALPHVSMEVSCSSGTYIRSLAVDLGRALGPGAHLTSLRRLSSGAFRVGNALRSKDISEQDGDTLSRKMIPLRDALPALPEVKVDMGLAKKIRQGHQPTWETMCQGIGGLDDTEAAVKVVAGEELVAIAEVHQKRGNGGYRIKIGRVFS